MMKKVFKYLTVLTISVVVTGALCPYGYYFVSPFNYKEIDLNRDGFLSWTEVFYASDYDIRQKYLSGKFCKEYFSRKDALTIAIKCKQGHAISTNQLGAEIDDQGRLITSYVYASKSNIRDYVVSHNHS